MVDITGKQDAIKMKEEYQKVLNQMHGAIKHKIDWLYSMNHKLKDNLAAVQKYKKHIVVDEDEKKELYNSLYNLLKDEKNFEKEMMKLSQKNKGKTNVVIKPRIKDSDIDNLRINAVQEYLNKYPEYATKSSFKKILDEVSHIEKGVKDTKRTYNHHVSEVLRELSYWPRNILEAEDLIKKFKNDLKEYQIKLENMRYHKSIIYKFAS